MAKRPDMKAYFWWQTITRRHPGGLMPKADAARVLGMSPQGVDYRTYSGKLSTIADPLGHEWLIVDQVLSLMAELALDILQAPPENESNGNIPSVRELLSGVLKTADNTYYV